MKRDRYMKGCEDGDPACPHHGHLGNPKCDRDATVILLRVDMEDRTGTAFCDPCAENALSSGLFREEGV